MAEKMWYEDPHCTFCGEALEVEKTGNAVVIDGIYWKNEINHSFGFAHENCLFDEEGRNQWEGYYPADYGETQEDREGEEGENVESSSSEIPSCLTGVFSR